ncbi:17920_t:CDS:10, partial [Racocetra persica]
SVAISYFEETSHFAWSFSGFLLAVKAFWSTASLSDDLISVMKKRYTLLLKNIQDNDKDEQRRSMATFLIQQVWVMFLVVAPVVAQLKEGDIPSLSMGDVPRKNSTSVKKLMELINLDEQLIPKKACQLLLIQITALNVFDEAYIQQTDDFISELERPVKRLHAMAKSNNKKNDDNLNKKGDNDSKEYFDYGDETIIKLEELKTIDDNDKENNEAINEVKQNFKSNYLKMRSDKKWKLPSNKFVEDVLYEYAKNLPYESFIIDTKNKTIMNLFSEDDQRHIASFNVLADPEVPDELTNFLLRYRKDCLQEIDIFYLMISVIASLPRYELRFKDFTRSHLEGWYKTNVWSVIVDSCLIDVENIEFIRKNNGKKSTKTKALYGRKCDGIAQELGTPEEFSDGTKYLSDGSLKMPKVMRNMLKQKISKYGVSFVKTNQLEIIRFLHSAQYLQTLVITIPSGYMCQLIRYPFNKISTDLANIDDLIKMVHDMLVAKCLDCSNNSNNINIISNEEFKQRLKKKISELQNNNDYNFPDTPKTP